jgi:fructose-bisphosphate aldolase class 1
VKTENLESLAKKLVAPGKGILAADESAPTICFGRYTAEMENKKAAA